MDIFDNNHTVVSLDTCILQNHRFNLQHHLYQRLAELSHRGVRLVLAEVVYREIIQHMAKEMEKLHKSLVKELSLAASYFADDESVAQKMTESFRNAHDFVAVAKKRTDEYLQKCNGTVLKTDELIQTGQILDLYFDAKPPFEPTGKKRNEFKDAIALKTLESFATQWEKKVYIASADAGWQAFCEDTDLLECMLLPELLDHIQRQSGEYENFISQISSQLFNSDSAFYQNVERHFALAITDFCPDVRASTAFYYDETVSSVTLHSLHIPQGNINIIDINAAGCTLSVPVQAGLVAEVRLDIYPTENDWLDDATLIGTVKRTGNVDFIGTIEIVLKGDWQKGFGRMTLDEVIYDYNHSHRFTLDLGEIDGLL